MDGQSQSWSPDARRRGASRGRAFTVTVALALLALLTVAVAAQAYSPGQRVWVKKYGTTAHQVDFNAVASGPGGVACVVGQQGRSGDDDMRGVVVKYTAAGKKLWARNYPAGASTDFCELTHVAFDAFGNIYVLGQRQVKGSPTNMVLAKFSAKGALKWSRQYDGPAHLGDFPGGLAVDARGFVYMSGSSQVSPSTWAVAVLKYDGAGRMKWKQPARIEPAGASCNNRDLALDSARNVYVVGQHTISPVTSLYLVKLSGATGAEVASAMWRPAAVGGVACATSLAVRGSTVVVGGYGYAATGATRDALVAAYTLGLAERYAPVLFDGDAHGTDTVHDVAVDSKGNAIATGDAYVDSPYTDAALTFKVDALGAVLWHDAYPGAANDAIGESIVVDGAGNAYVAGCAANAAEWDNLLVAKYAAGATFKRPWLKTWGGANNVDDAGSIVLGPKGTLYLCCQSQTGAGLYQGVIARYAR
jgi:hypothetical protein